MAAIGAQASECTARCADLQLRQGHRRNPRWRQGEPQGRGVLHGPGPAYDDLDHECADDHLDHRCADHNVDRESGHHVDHEPVDDHVDRRPYDDLNAESDHNVDHESVNDLDDDRGHAWGDHDERAGHVDN